jgi:hypothetical protein
MVEALIAVIDRLIQIAQGRIAGRKEMFDRVLEPVFTDLVVIHGDYVKMFETVREMLPPGAPKGSPELDSARTELRNRRMEYEPVRRKIEAFAQQLGSARLPAEERAFVVAVIEYFEFTTFAGPKVQRISTATRILEYFDEAEDASAIWSHLWDTTRGLRERWSAVTVSFAAMKIAVAGAR